MESTASQLTGDRKVVYDMISELNFWCGLGLSMERVRLMLDVQTDEEVRRLRTILRVRANQEAREGR